MKLAIVTDWYLPRMGGLELHVRDLAQGLAASGCQVDVVTATRSAPRQQTRGHPAVDLPHPEGVGLHRLGSPVAPVFKFLYTTGAGREMASLFRRERYDLVHSMIGIVSPAAIAGAWVARGVGIPSVVTFHSILSGFGPALGALDRLMGWSSAPALFSAVSDAVARDVQKLLPGRTVHRLPNGVNPASWSVEHVPGSPAELRLLSVMRLNARKRGHVLLRAVARAQAALADGVRLRLTLVGEGPEGRRLRRLARTLGLAEHVRFEGVLSREAVRALFARSDVFVLASALESFGIAALEARAAGVPVVALERGGIKEFVRDGRDGLLARSDEELAQHIVRLARSPELVAALAAGAREQPVPFAWEHTLARHLDAYRTVLGEDAPQVGERSGLPDPAAPRPDAA